VLFRDDVIEFVGEEGEGRWDETVFTLVFCSFCN